MKPDKKAGLNFDPCMMNPINCTDGISFSVWEQMAFPSNVIDSSENQQKKYVISNGGDFNPRNGKAWPGFAIFHQGLEIVAVVSTGDKVWELRVSGQLYNNTWTEIGVRFMPPDLSKPKWAQMGERGLEKMGGLEMYINLEKVGHSILPESTDRGSTRWSKQPTLTLDGTPEGEPVMMMGCHQNSEMKAKGNQFTGFAGTDDYPALFDELAVWRRRLAPHELSFFLGGYAAEFESINAQQFNAMLGNVDLEDPEQANAAQAVLEAMLIGPPTTVPPFPTRTRAPTKETSTTEAMDDMVTKKTTTTTTTTTTEANSLTRRKTMLSRQNIMSNMLTTKGVSEGQDPEEVEGRFALSIVATSILAGNQDNIEHWAAVHEEPEHEGPQKTVKQLEEYMLAWVGSVNTSAEREDDQHWKTSYFDSNEDSMRYATHAEDFVLNVDKLPFSSIREGGSVRMQYPDYNGWEWAEANAKWENVKDNFTVPTGMFKDIPGCRDLPMSILTAIYNGLPKIGSPRRNPVNIRSENFFVDSKVISVRTKMAADNYDGDPSTVYHCEPDRDYMKNNPVRLTMYHRQPAKTKRTLLWHSDDYWEGLEVRHCVFWNERFGTNGAWDDTSCKVTYTDEEKTNCECSEFGSYAVLAEMLQQPDMDDNDTWVMIVKHIGIIIGTVLLTIFVAVVFLSVVVGEMFHQLRMYCCLSYMIANLLMLVGDTTVCDDRHNNMAISMCLMYFFQASLWWNMCEAHATFKGVTAGLINGRTSVYHPIAWGMPFICIGFLCFLYGELLGTHPNCFISWENDPINIFFYYNSICFLLTFTFLLFVGFNIMKVQSRNKETVEYLRDQTKGLFLTSFLMFALWSTYCLGWLAYYKDPTREMISMMPAFQICNGWFGVILFLALGMWSRRFRIALYSQAEEKKKMLEEKAKMLESQARTNKSGDKYEEPNKEDLQPLGSPLDGKSLAGSTPGSPQPLTRPTTAGSRSATAGSRSATAGSRPATAGSMSATAGSRPATAGSRPATAGSRPATAGASGTSRPASSVADPKEETDLEKLEKELDQAGVLSD